MKHIEKIVVGTDFSDIAERAVDQAMDLAAQVGAFVTIVHAYELPVYSFPDGVVVSSAEAADKMTTELIRRLEALAERQRDRGVSVKTALRMGAPWDELNRVATEEGADVIVVGTHGRRGFSRVILGSVAERMVRTAVRPLLIVRAES